MFINCENKTRRCSVNMIRRNRKVQKRTYANINALRHFRMQFYFENIVQLGDVFPRLVLMREALVSLHGTDDHRQPACNGRIVRFS